MAHSIHIIYAAFSCDGLCLYRCAASLFGAVFNAKQFLINLQPAPQIYMFETFVANQLQHGDDRFSPPMKER